MSRTIAELQGVMTDGVKAPMRRLAAVVTAHPVVDAYSNFIPPLLGVLRVRCDLTPLQAASLLSIGSLSSGLSQPLFAWLSDRTDSRVFGAVGLAVAAICLSSIGWASDYASLVVLFSIGMIGVGAFHPIAAASAGQLSGKRRTIGVTMFFAAGMLGSAVGPLVSTRLTALEGGFDLLQYCMVPGILCAMVLHVAVRRTPHGQRRSEIDAGALNDLSRRWFMVINLFISSAMRYSVNMALVYLFVRWAEHLVAAEAGLEDAKAIATAGSIIAGNVNACTMLGMGAGGLLVGLCASPVREKWMFILVPIVFAPAIAFFGSAGTTVGYALGFASGVGFAALIPVSISLAQRLLPHRTSLASSFTMGGAWAVAMVGPLLAAEGVERIGLERTFLITACVLAVSGLVSLPLRTDGLNGVRSGRASE